MTSQPQSVLTSTPTQTVQAFLDAFARHDIDAAVAVADPQVSVTVHPLGLQQTGADALRQVLADLVRGFPDLVISVSRVITTGDVVTALFKAEGTQSADYAGAINQEKHLDIDQAWRFVVDGGLITETLRTNLRQEHRFAGHRRRVQRAARRGRHAGSETCTFAVAEAGCCAKAAVETKRLFLPARLQGNAGLPF